MTDKIANDFEFITKRMKEIQSEGSSTTVDNKDKITIPDSSSIWITGDPNLLVTSNVVFDATNTIDYTQIYVNPFQT